MIFAPERMARIDVWTLCEDAERLASLLTREGSVHMVERRISTEEGEGFSPLERQNGRENIERLGCEVAKQDGIESRIDQGGVLHVRITDGRSHALALAGVLKLVDAGDLTLEAIHSGRNATENAYLQLLQEDQSHGFDR